MNWASENNNFIVYLGSSSALIFSANMVKDLKRFVIPSSASYLGEGADLANKHVK